MWHLKGNSEGNNRQSNTYSDCTLLAPKSMDIGTSAVIDRPSASPSYSTGSTSATGPLPQGLQVLEVGGLENIR
jgi:hypothetical protein